MSAILEKEITTEEVFAEIEKFMDDQYSIYKQGTDYNFEYYVDYLDEVSDSTIKEAIEKADKHRAKGELPDYRQAFDEEIWDSTTWWDNYEENELRKQIEDHLSEIYEDEDFTNEINDFIMERCHWNYPESYLNRDVKVNIMIDTGNWNGDCVADDVLNWDSQYYCPRNRNGKRIIPKESSLLWLAKQQKKKQKLEKAIANYDKISEIAEEYAELKRQRAEDMMKPVREMCSQAENAIKAGMIDYAMKALAKAKELDEITKRDIIPEIEKILDEEFQEKISDLKSDDKFINSCIQEYENLSSHMGTMTFLVTMPLFGFFELKARVNGERDRRRDDRGFGCSTEKDLEIETVDSITIDKSVMCGLFSPWGGGGSVLGVECEKDIKIPLSILFDVSMDGEKTYGYDVNEVYGLVGSAWDAKVTLNFESAS